MGKLVYSLVEADGAECAPYQALKEMEALGKLPRAAANWGTVKGDCHAIAAAIMADIADAGSPLEWRWYSGDRPRIGAHSWIECDGWAIDASNGLRRKIIVMRAGMYRKGLRTTRTKLVKTVPITAT